MMRRYSEDDRARALELVSSVGQAAAARELAIPKGTVCGWASRARVRAPSNEGTQAATEARKATCAERRAALASELLDVVERLQASLWRPCQVYSFGGGDNTLRTATVAEPSPRDKQAIMTAIGISLDKHIALERHDQDAGGGMAAVDLWLAHLVGRKGTG